VDILLFQMFKNIHGGFLLKSKTGATCRPRGK